MIKKYFEIENIPAVLWGDTCEKIFIAIHGNMSNKEDKVIEILAEEAVKLGYQVISFDLPKHGARVEEKTPCKVQNCVKELKIIMNYVKHNWQDISLFACSMGAYFSLLSYKEELIKQCLFLSPVVDMKRIIENMMKYFNIDEQTLKEKEIINTPIGETLYWDYYTYVNNHPVDKWHTKTYVLYGLKDDLCEVDRIENFTKKFNCDFTIMDDGEHYFHTKEQLNFFKQWLEKSIII